MGIAAISAFKAMNTARMSNSLYSAFRSRDAQMSLVSFAGKMNTSTPLREEQRLTSNSIISALMYKISCAQAEALEKLEKKNIERSFSTFG